MLRGVVERACPGQVVRAPSSKTVQPVGVVVGWRQQTRRKCYLLYFFTSSGKKQQTVTVVMLGYDWWLCMVINISVQHIGGLLPDIIILLTQGYYQSVVGNPFKYQGMALYL